MPPDKNHSNMFQPEFLFLVTEPCVQLWKFKNKMLQIFSFVCWWGGKKRGKEGWVFYNTCLIILKCPVHAFVMATTDPGLAAARRQLFDKILGKYDSNFCEGKISAKPEKNVHVLKQALLISGTLCWDIFPFSPTSDKLCWHLESSVYEPIRRQLWIVCQQWLISMRHFYITLFKLCIFKHHI